MHEFARDERLPSYFMNVIQDFLSAARTDLRLTRKDATHIEVAPVEPYGVAAIDLEGRWRWNSVAVSRVHPGGAAGTYAVWAVATDQNISESPKPFTDDTVYAFDLRITDGSNPTGEGVEVFEKIGEVVWDGVKITSLRQTYNAVTGSMIADGALSGEGDIDWTRDVGGAWVPQVKTNAIGAAELADASVDTAALVDLCVTTAKVAAASITESKYAAGSIPAAALKALAVETAAIAAQAVTEGKLGLEAVNTGQLKNLGVTAAKLAALAVETGKIANLAVTAAKLANLAVTTEKIADGAVTDAKLASPNNLAPRKIFSVSGALWEIPEGFYRLIPLSGKAMPLNGHEQEGGDAGPLIRFVASDYAVAGKTTKMRVVGVAVINGAPGPIANPPKLQFGFNPVNAIAGAANKLSIDLGAGEGVVTPELVMGVAGEEDFDSGWKNAPSPGGLFGPGLKVSSHPIPVGAVVQVTMDVYVRWE